MHKQSHRRLHNYHLQDILYKVTVEPLESDSQAPILFDMMDAVQAALEYILKELQDYAATHPHKDEEHQVCRFVQFLICYKII